MSTKSGINKIRIENYKSIVDETIRLGLLTVLAGANNAGKSNLMQPLLLLKQTLEEPSSPYGPVISFSGANVPLTTFDQIRSKVSPKPDEPRITVGDETLDVTVICRRNENFLEVVGNKFCYKDKDNYLFELLRKMSDAKLLKTVNDWAQKLDKPLIGDCFKIEYNDCFFGFRPCDHDRTAMQMTAYAPYSRIKKEIKSVIHIPGLRVQTAARESNERPFPLFPKEKNPKYNIAGAFPEYTATMIYAWKQENNGRFTQLQESIRRIGLTNKVSARRTMTGNLEILVGWDPRNEDPKDEDMVNIADVGIGVSQALPFIVALIAARPGQIVYIEQPSIHLHPKAVVALAEIIFAAIKRGVRVVVETHSDLLVLAIQAVALREIKTRKVKFEDIILYWVTKNTDPNIGIVGETKAKRGGLDQYGNCKDWPEDFSHIIMEQQMTFIDARLEREENDRRRK